MLEPEPYLNPIVKLQQLAGRNDHMHLDEVRYRESDGRLYVCSYDFAVVNANDPGNMKYMVQQLKVVWPAGQGNPAYATGARTGGCIALAVEGDYVYTTHRGNIDDPSYLGGWRLTPAAGNTLTGTQLPLLAEAGTSYEGIDVGADGYIYVALGEEGLGVYDFDSATSTWTRLALAEGFNHAFAVRVAGTTAYVADGLGGLVTVDITDPLAPVLTGRAVTGGQARDLRVNGATAYVAAGSNGLKIVDVSDIFNPTVIGAASMPGSAQRLDYSAGRVHVAAWNDARVYDVSDPANPTFVGAARMTRQLSGTTAADQDGRPEVTSRVLGIAAYNDIMFAGNWHVPYSYRIHSDRAAPFIFLPEDVNLLDFGPVAAGESETVDVLVRNEGTAALDLIHNWASNPAFTVEPRQIQIPAGGSETLSLTYTPTETAEGVAKETSYLSLMSDDPEQPVRRGYLVGNRPGLGVGVALPETVVALVDGGEWSSSAYAGQVRMLAYFATF